MKRIAADGFQRAPEFRLKYDHKRDGQNGDRVVENIADCFQPEQLNKKSQRKNQDDAAQQLPGAGIGHQPKDIVNNERRNDDVHQVEHHVERSAEKKRSRSKYY